MHFLLIKGAVRCYEATCNSCNMDTRDLPDMYALNPRAAR